MHFKIIFFNLGDKQASHETDSIEIGSRSLLLFLIRKRDLLRTLFCRLDHSRSLMSRCCPPSSYYSSYFLSYSIRTWTKVFYEYPFLGPGWAAPGKSELVAVLLSCDWKLISWTFFKKEQRVWWMNSVFRKATCIELMRFSLRGFSSAHRIYEQSVR